MIESPKEYTIKGYLRAFKSIGEYTNLIVENVEETDGKHRYLWLTIPPNWSDVNIKINELMFFNFIIAEAGERYYDVKKNCVCSYSYSTNWYKKSIPLNCISESRELIIA